MTPVQQAFEAWIVEAYTNGIGIASPSHARLAFEAGYNAAARLLLPVIDSSLLEPLGDAGRGNTPVEPQKPAIAAETVYAAYPRKIGKQDAIKAIKKAAKAAGIYALLKATNAYAEATSKWPEADKQYIPHPATWYNRGSYDDDPKEWERGGQASQFSVHH